MARSMLRQFTQVSGSLTYDDTLDMAYATVSGLDLETDLNYIRSQLKNIIDKTNWYDTPRTIETSMTPTGSDEKLLTEKAIYDWVNTVSGAITSSDTFLGLEDTIDSYTENRVLFETATTVSDSGNFTYDPGNGLYVGDHAAFGDASSVGSFTIIDVNEDYNQQYAYGVYVHPDNTYSVNDGSTVGIYSFLSLTASGHGEQKRDGTPP